MHSRIGRAFARNVLIAACLGLPVALLLFASFQFVREGDPADTVLEMLGGAGVIYLSLIVPTIVGAILYTACLYLAGPRVGIARRATALILTPVVILPWLALRARELLMYAPFAVCVAIGLALIGTLAAGNDAERPHAGI